MDIPSLIVGLALAIVVGILVAGIFLMGRKGPKAAALSNKLMRARVIAQFAAIILILVIALVANR